MQYLGIWGHQSINCHTFNVVGFFVLVIAIPWNLNEFQTWYQQTIMECDPHNLELKMSIVLGSGNILLALCWTITQHNWLKLIFIVKIMNRN